MDLMTKKKEKGGRIESCKDCGIFYLCLDLFAGKGRYRGERMDCYRDAEYSTSALVWWHT